MDDTINRQAAIDAIQYAGKIGKQTCISILRRLPSAQPELDSNDWQGDRISNLAKENEQLRKPQNFNTVKDMIKDAVDRGETLEDALDYLVNSIYAKGYIDAVRDMENEK